MTPWFDRLCWLLFGLAVVGMAVLAAEDTAALSEGWTFPANCLPRW